MKNNILHISRSMGIGGAEKVVFQLSTSLKSNFNNVVVASTGGSYVEDLITNNIYHEKIIDIESKNLREIFYNIKKLKNIIKKYNINIIHVHHRMGLLYSAILKNKGIRVIYTAHNIFRDKKYLYNKLLNHTEIVAVGNSVKKSLIDDIKINKPIEVIFNCVKENSLVLEEVDSEFQNFKGKKILFVGRLSEQKGIKYLLDSINKISYEDFKLFIIGDGEDRNYLKDIVKENNIQDKVVFIGFQKNPNRYILESDFLVMPSLWEGFPLTPIECFMNKKTIVASEIPGIIDIVNNNNGLLVQPKDSNDLAQKISLLLNDNDLRRLKEEEAFNTYLSKFTYEVFLENYLKLYSEERL